MVKTTLYLSDELKRAVEVAARRLGISEAEFYRQALAEAVGREQRPEPHWGILPSRCGPASSDVASNVDAALADGFGSD